MPERTQLSFGLALPTSWAEADFLPAPGNDQALAWLGRWPDWPGGALLLHGPPGAGKTHLAHIWCARTGAAMLGGAQLRSAGPDALARGHLALDDADLNPDPASLFHLINLQRERGHTLLLTAGSAAARWAGILPDLASRLKSIPNVELHQPDDGLLAAVMQKLFADRQIPVPPEVIAYLLPRMERSFHAARSWVARLDAAALSAKRPVTMALVRGLLEQPDQS